jgi:hypothetical protein
MISVRPDIKLKINDRKLTVRWRSLRDFEAVLKWARKSKAKTSRRHESCKPATDWHGNVSNARYEQMLKNGWPEGVDGVQELDGLATDAAERIAFQRDVGGAFPIVPAYLSGAPDSMLRPHPDVNENQRGLTLVIDSSFHCGIGGDTVLKYAQTVMQLIAWLEAERIETAVYVVHTAIYRSERVMHVTPIREAGQILQPERLAALVHPAFLRRAQFAMLEYDCYEFGHHGGTVPIGYGTPSHTSIAEMQAILPEAYSVIMLPKVGQGDPAKAVEESINLKLRRAS